MFDVTYEIITEESAKHGDAAERGYIVENTSLREAITAVFETRTSHCPSATAIEANECPVQSPEWITVYNGKEYLTGAYENRSIHFPDKLTNATRRRIARLMGCYGI